MIINDEIYKVLVELYELYRDKKIEVNCLIETNYQLYHGNLIFDNLDVIPTDALILKNVLVTDKINSSDAIRVEKSIIKFHNINAFSYLIKG